MGDFGGIVQQGGKSLCLIDVKASLIYFLRASEYILGNFEVKKKWSEVAILLTGDWLMYEVKPAATWHGGACVGDDLVRVNSFFSDGHRAH